MSQARPPLELTRAMAYRFNRAELSNRQRVHRLNKKRRPNDQIEVEKVDFPAIVIAWNGCCGLCCMEIDLTLPGSHDDGLTLEHLHSLGQGGGHIKRNIVPAHRRCNLDKAAKKDGPGAAKIKRRLGLKGQRARRERKKAAGKYKPIPSRPFQSASKIPRLGGDKEKR